MSTSFLQQVQQKKQRNSSDGTEKHELLSCVWLSWERWLLPDTSRPPLPRVVPLKTPPDTPHTSGPAPIWTRSTPPSWPIFCRYSSPSHLHNFYNLSRAAAAASIIVSLSSVRANYTTTFSDLSNFSRSLFLFISLTLLSEIQTL